MVTIEEIKLLIEKFEKIKKSDFEQLINSHLDDLKNIKEMIERKDRETGTMTIKGPAWFRTDLLEKKDNARDEILYHAIKDKLNHFAKTNKYNSLEIGPGRGQFSTLFYAWKKQFFLDLLPEYQKKLRRVFNPLHERRYVKYFTTDGHHCADVPVNSVNFIFSWDTFVFFTEDQIDQYLSNMNQVLIPGGYVMIQYADCHYDQDLNQSKRGYWGYNNKSIMEKLILKNGYSVIEMDQFKPGLNYAIFKKPGNENPVVYKLSELTLD
jgi:hypothetical protein|tara:strand:+ start:195 stop:992 length:798 start_codon:yes stop_codon:yes gene_type:complete